MLIIVQKNSTFQYIKKKFMATSFSFLTRNNEPSTLPYLHPYVIYLLNRLSFR